MLLPIFAFPQFNFSGNAIGTGSTVKGPSGYVDETNITIQVRATASVQVVLVSDGANPNITVQSVGSSNNVVINPVAGSYHWEVTNESGAPMAGFAINMVSAAVFPVPIVEPFAPTGTLQYNVVEYGADSSGNTDSTVAIQNAINAASAAGGGTVWFPAGTYLVNQTTAIVAGGMTAYSISIPSNVTLLGAANGGSVVKSTLAVSAGTRTVFTNASTTAGNVNIALQNLTIQTAANSAGNYDEGLWGFGITNCFVSGCQFTNCGMQANAIVSKINVNGVNVTGLNHNWVVSMNVFNSCVEALGFFQGQYLTFNNNQVLNSLDSSVSINSSGQYITICDNVIDRQSRGTAALGCVELTQDGAVTDPFAEFTISGNVCASNGNGPGIAINGVVSNGTVTGNLVWNNTTNGIIVHSGCNNITVTGNRVLMPAASTANGILIGSDAVGLSQITCVGNVVTTQNAAATAINCGTGANTVTDVVISDNICTGTGFGINLGANTSANGRGVVLNNILTGSAAGTITGAGTGWIKRSNSGFNPVGVETPAIGASPLTVAAVDHDRTYYLTTAGAGATTIAIAGGPTISIPAGGNLGTFRIPAQTQFVLTYANAPTWVVEGE